MIHSNIVFSAKNSLPELSYDKMWSPHNWATMNKSHGLLSFNSIDATKVCKAFQDEKDASKTLCKEKTHSHELKFMTVPFVWRLSKQQSSDMDWVWVRNILFLVVFWIWQLHWCLIRKMSFHFWEMYIEVSIGRDHYTALISDILI